MRDAGLFVALLEGDGLQELADPQPARVAGRPSRGKDVIRADGLVAICDGRRLTEEERAVVPHPLEVPARVRRLDLDMLEGVGVGQADGLVVRFDHDHLAVVVPGPAGGLRCRQVAELDPDLSQRLVRHGLGRGDEDGRRGRPVLRLTQKIGGDDLRVRGVVRDDEYLGGACHEVDPDRAEQPALGLDHVGVARPDQDVDAFDRLRPVCERSERLNSAEDVDLVRAREMHGSDGGIRHSAVERRGAGRDALNARDLRRDDAHVRRGDHRIPAAGHIRTDARDRNVPVAQPYTRKRLDLEVDHRRALRLCETPDLLLAERDVLEHLCRDPAEAG